MHATQQPATEPNPTPTGNLTTVSRRWDGQPETDADRRFLDLREGGYTGWIDQDGHPVEDLDAWKRQVGWTGPSTETADTAVVSQPGSNRAVCAATRETVTAADTLRAAANYLDTYGRIQGEYYDLTGPAVLHPAACLVGGLAMTCYGRPVDQPSLLFDDPAFPEFEAAITYLDEFLLDRYEVRSYEFNDAEGRSDAEIGQALREAADAWEHRESACGPDPTAGHADYPHLPGTLYDCPACESQCCCTPSFECLHCTVEAEQDQEAWLAERERAVDEALDAIDRYGYGGAQ